MYKWEYALVMGTAKRAPSSVGREKGSSQQKAPELEYKGSTQQRALGLEFRSTRRWAGPSFTVTKLND